MGKFVSMRSKSTKNYKRGATTVSMVEYDSKMKFFFYWNFTVEHSKSVYDALKTESKRQRYLSLLFNHIVPSSDTNSLTQTESR